MMSTDEDEQLDPRVQVELEKLNTATDDINKLESKLEEANHAFRATLSESTARLKTLAKKLGSCIEKARPYYEAQELARSSQLECQRAAVQYQRASALHQAARETIALAEERFVNCRQEHFQFDSAWQEMLNHATMKVMEAEAQKAASEREHMQRAAAFTQAEQRVQQLQRGLRSAINKSLIYFEEKTAITAQLESQKEQVQQLQQAVTTSKASYAQTLKSLEMISEEIHEQRRCRLPREPGVGAELTPPEVSDTREVFNQSAKSFTPLEEMTAKDEKYWETLREKLEKLQAQNQNSTLPEDILLDVENLEGRERTLTGSSSVSNTGESEQSVDTERVISGESSTNSGSDGALSPQAGEDKILLEDILCEFNDICLDSDTSLNKRENIPSINIQDVGVAQSNEHMHIVDSGSEIINFPVKFSIGDEFLEDKSLDCTRTTGDLITHTDNGSLYSDLNKGNINVNLACDVICDNSKLNDNSGNARFTAEKPECLSLDDVEVTVEDSDKESIVNSDDNNTNLNEFKERGDGSSSPLPAMCQPSRSLNSIPEIDEN